jgi:hypothetical protein
MNIAAVVTATVDQQTKDYSIINTCLKLLKQNSNEKVTTIFFVDNGSSKQLKIDCDNVIRLDKNEGINPVFHSTLKFFQDFDIIAHFHCDLLVREKDWDRQIVQLFCKDSQLALVGFVGSDTIDERGGRGGGTMLNFVGDTYSCGEGSPAEVHGLRYPGVRPAAVLDHCSLIFRRSILEKLPPSKESGYVPHHFYDRILCCEVLHRGYHILYYGAKCDHLNNAGLQLSRSGFTDYGQEWLKEHGSSYTSTSAEDISSALHAVGEKIFLTKWRNNLQFIPIIVAPNFSLLKGTY